MVVMRFHVVDLVRDKNWDLNNKSVSAKVDAIEAQV